MADTNDSVLLRPNTVGMDMAPPYAVYVDGFEIARYDSEREASKHFNLLTGRDSLRVEVSLG